MRIDCSKCGAVFAIDERWVTAKGVRAQCPLCAERVLVRPQGVIGLSKPTPAPDGASQAGSVGDGPPWRIRRADGSEKQVSFARLREMFEAQQFAEGDEIARGDAAFWPPLDHPTIQALHGGKRTATSSGGLARFRHRVPAKLWILCTLAILALVVIGWFVLPWGSSRKALPTQDAFDRRLVAWQTSMPPSTHTAAEYEAMGRTLLREDTPEALQAALTAFRQALVLAPESAGAIAGYVEARSLLGFSEGDTDPTTEARDLIEHAVQLDGKRPEVLRAQAHLLLSLDEAGNMLEARALAEMAVERSIGAADDRVALGRSYIGSNVDLALWSLDDALAKDPQHRRALLYRGQAKERVGRYSDAAADYQVRLDLSPGDPEALRGLLRVSAEVGAYDRVRRILGEIAAHRPNDPEAKLDLAVLAYQLDGDGKGTAPVFVALASDATLPLEIRGRAAGHAAAVAREAGDLDRATVFAASAAALGPAAAPARFQEVLLALAHDRPDESRRILETIPADLLDPADRALLEGRIHVAAGRHREAVASFQAAQRSRPRRIEPYLHLASAYARLGDAYGAFGAIRAALELDPAVSRRDKVLIDFYESRRSRLARLEAPLLAMASDRVDLALMHAAAGIVRYQRGEGAQAVPLLRRTLDLDPQAVPALAYLAQLALDSGDARRALPMAQTVGQIEKLMAIGPFLEGRAQEALRESGKARSAYERALAANPAFYAAAVRLGELAMASGDRAEAERRFLQAFHGDPANTDARVALFELGK